MIIYSLSLYLSLFPYSCVSEQHFILRSRFINSHSQNIQEVYWNMIISKSSQWSCWIYSCLEIVAPFLFSAKNYKTCMLYSPPQICFLSPYFKRGFLQSKARCSYNSLCNCYWEFTSWNMCVTSVMGSLWRPTNWIIAEDDLELTHFVKTSFIFSFNTYQRSKAAAR